MLKIWTNTNEFSQDTVHVIVHPFIAYEATSDLGKNSQDPIFKFINKNIIQIEIDLEPKYFTESLKQNFLKKVEILMQQSELKFKKPKIILINTLVSTRSAKSRVMVEFLVAEDYAPENLKAKQTEDTIESRKLAEISQDFGSKPASELTLPEFQRIISSDEIVKLVKIKLRTHSFIDSLIVLARTATTDSKINQTPDQSSIIPSADYSDLKINFISQLTCDNSRYYRNYNCSNHGQCDSYTHKCICNKYWMPNLYLYYLNYENDFTNGNNCGNYFNRKN